MGKDFQNNVEPHSEHTPAAGIPAWGSWDQKATMASTTAVTASGPSESWRKGAGTLPRLKGLMFP